MVAVTIKGDVEKLRVLGKLMREVPDKELKRELFKAVQRATKPVKEEIKQSALDTLPHGGGLNVWVSKIGIKTKQSYSGRMPGVTITGTLDNKSVVRRKTTFGPLREGEKRSTSSRHRKSGTFGARADLRAINRGRVMHPVFGHGPLVGPQMVRAGFWDRPLTGVTAQRAKREIRDAMQRVTGLIAARMRSAA